MKKKLISVLAALALVATQCVIGPLAVSADTWVDDSSYAAGGYWMDDSGYIISGSTQSAPSAQTKLVKGAAEPSYNPPQMPSSESSNTTSASPVDATAATSGTLTRAVSDNPSAVQFTYTANGEVEFLFYIGNDVKSPQYTASNGVLTVFDTTSDYYVVMVPKGGTASQSLASATSLHEHTYTVSYEFDGATVLIESGSIASGMSTNHTAPLTYSYSGVEYMLTGGEMQQTQQIFYGKSAYTFSYEVFDPQDLTATIKCETERGEVLASYDLTLTYRGGNVYQDLPATIEKDGVQYERIGNTNRITLNYFSTTLDYTITYREVQPQNTQPYAVRVNYVDSETGAVIGGSYFTITAQNIADAANVTLTLPQEVAFYTGDSTIYYQPVSAAGLSHPAADDSTRTYTVQYQKMAEDAPYTWSVRLYDLATNTLLGTVPYTVTVSSNATHDCQPEITVNGTRYLLDGSMSSAYTHNYGDNGRVQNIYYNAEDSAAVSAYDVTVQLMDITSNTVLNTETRTATADGALEISTEETLTVGENEYVRLLGQSDTISHGFYTPQRTYTVYYRNANDEQNADTVIRRVETITTETVVTTEPEVETPATTEPEAPAPVTDEGEEIPDTDAPLADPTQGEGQQTTVIDGNGGQQLVDDEGRDLEEDIPDADAPQADSDKLTQNDGASSPNIWIWVVIGAVIVIALAIGFIFVKKSKKNQNS